MRIWGIRINQNNSYDVVILGAGIAGLSAAKRLAGNGLRVAVIEASDRCGGAHKSANIGPYTFDYGSIFYEENARIFTLATGLKELCPTANRRQRRIAPNGQLVHYPVEPRELLKGPFGRLVSSALDLLVSRVFVRRDGTLAALLRKRLGNRFLNDTGLRDYIIRLTHKAPSQIDERFFFQRMAFLDRFTKIDRLLAAGLRSIASKKAINANTKRALYIRPQAGFETLFNPLRSELEDAGVEFHFNQPVIRIGKDGAVPNEAGHSEASFVIHTKTGSFRGSRLINTMPVESLHCALFGESAGLESINMTTLFVSAGSLAKGAGNVLFNFHKTGRWKRATIYSRLYPDVQIDREFMAVEVTLAQGHPHEPEEAFADFAAQMGALGIASDMRLEGSVFSPACYPQYSLDADEKLAAALERILASGVITIGRQGRFEYLPTSSGVIRRVNAELDLAGICRKTGAVHS